MVINFRPLKVEKRKPIKLDLHVRKSDYVKKQSEFGYIGPQTAVGRFDLYAGRHYRKNGHIISC